MFNANCRQQRKEVAPDTSPLPACELCSQFGDRPVSGSALEKALPKHTVQGSIQSTKAQSASCKGAAPSPPREEDNGLEVPADPKKPHQLHLVQDNADLDHLQEKLSRSQVFTPFHRPSTEFIESGP